MTGVNHVAGGVVFTGLFTSFWNINIFKNPWYLFFTVFFAILPDVDHLKSPIGKLFYPLAKFLDRRFGHRTITHSLVCYLGLGVVVGFIEHTFFQTTTITLIFWFAYLSHIMFDMMTVQGVPFFYPFRRNPCVIPGDSKLRLRSGDLRSEAVVLFVFLIIGITCKGLFENGFWTTYNRAFGTVKHLHQEHSQTDRLMTLDYSFTDQGKEHSGNGYVIETKDNEALILTKKGFLTITDKMKIKKLKPEKTKREYRTGEHIFISITPDSLRQIVKDKGILNLKLQSKTPFRYLASNRSSASKSVELKEIYNPVFEFVPDTNKADIKKQLELVNYEIHKKNSEALSIQQSRHRINSRIAEITRKLNDMDNYHREHATTELKELKRELETLESDSDVGKLYLRRKHLLSELNETEEILVSGYVKYVKI